MFIIILSFLLIFGTHYFLRNNQTLHQFAFWKLLLISCIGLVIIFIVSVELNTFYPIMIALLVTCTMLQKRFLQLFQRGR
ncbi:hypothetical protein IV487_02055 [Enterococcus saccharolyticus]|uniref:Uncharacterized protein n=1 Tax=Candidatus Enterococcus willemsii TaxID=1857215 RepID=A0ABQ6Z0J1_9ENTE|nr:MULTISPECIES: hypothetical protein [Enterococcus]KAF1304517.1 hypothetical protein BAU17_09955 [Enterococcus sp. CU12B]MCD5001248.1 hypothetical protein [Enterococcus saccharolyticus]